MDFFRLQVIASNSIEFDSKSIHRFKLSNEFKSIENQSNHRVLDRSKSASTVPKLSYPSLFSCYVKKGRFSWYDIDCGAKDCTLSNINLAIPKGQLTIVVGSIGSGKSTLLASLIGETRLCGGEIHWLQENYTCFGYVPSTPWILNSTVFENILFGNDFDLDRYKEIINACCLQADIDLLPYGDQTIIGGHGISLSGGQRQRIALARALYSKAPTLILDDSLSALDLIVGYSVFENAILRLAIKHQKRTVILATHKQEYLSKTDYLIVMDSGTILIQGTLNQVEKLDKAFHYLRNVQRKKEITERLGQLKNLETCKTSEERNKLVRLLSKKKEFRGSRKFQDYWLLKLKMVLSNKLSQQFLSRQISWDLSNTLPLHEWCDDDDEELLMPISSSSSPQSNNRFRNQFSTFSWKKSQRKHSDLDSFENLSKDSDSFDSNPSEKSSNLSIFEDSEKRNENDDDSSILEDAISNLNEQFLQEMACYKENQLDTGTIYNFDRNPKKNRISFDVLLYYFQCYSYRNIAFVIGLIALNQLFRLISDYWLSNWIEREEKQNLSEKNSNDLIDQNRFDDFIRCYLILSILSVIISFFANLMGQLISNKAIRILHDNLLSTLVRCPMKFFDTTPIGRIINRFTYDLNIIDKKLPIAIPVLLRFLFLCCSALIINIVVCPFFIFFLIPILLIYYYLQKIFRCTSRQLQRLECSTKSPILSHFNETIAGLTTIRAFRREEMFITTLHRLLDANNLCFLLTNSSNCLLGIVLDSFGAIILFISMLLTITASLHWNLPTAFVGLTMTYMLLVPIYLNWLVRNLSQVEMNLNSVERVHRYTFLETEISCLNDLGEPNRIPDNWLQRGEIEFINVTIRYEANTEPIIYNANLHIKPGEKIGICGRTGSGKSSLIGALFRINQISSGQILIDGIDITRICPYRLRRELAIIPQDLVLFTGTIRDNLDPDYRYGDDKLWRILKEFHLDRTIRSLDEEIFNDSKSEMRFSAGERQLFCCARAFLSDSPLLIMDESTSMLDQKSSTIVMQQIHNSKKTILIIAHRISNIIDLDRIAVVDGGHIAEFDTPANLLSNSNSLFSNLYHRDC
ncbi:ABC transporter sub-family C-like protein 1 [Sarcoptes scabiei]|uniref:ABC transporter sub-family C-like protein 1 n=1 Tax=Sarcoptes scabiei TaxID=52283 RepID=A0A131ZU70_SARSC|nr:ABC transporter sub-family C-like protein 1 [Sarcoptes scabiei]